ncbi:hypothetical protein HYS49_03685 [Candidatus Woesearchaeota archaeon]|nr:hypothetical protein [Candidatus Woesearchaeota archaeon]
MKQVTLSSENFPDDARLPLFREKYPRLFTAKELRGVEGPYLCLFGDVLYDREREGGVYINGEAGIGKTTTVEAIAAADSRFLVAAEDRTLFDYNSCCFFADFEGIGPFPALTPFPLLRTLQLTKAGNREILYSGLAQSYEFLKEELGLKIDVVERVEKDGEKTAEKVLEMLCHQP